ncbi:hypothetical protein PM082_005118 [Marasmius tenuissimus]|nr:hypothetical protein PM082_005118 [Marasmius tenuissimus]
MPRRHECKFCQSGKTNVFGTSEPYNHTSEGLMPDNNSRFRINGNPIHRFEMGTTVAALSQKLSSKSSSNPRLKFHYPHH